MHKRVLSALVMLVVVSGAYAQQQSAPGKIVCWKDKSGKILGCGDKVPPEYQDYATKELNHRGVTVKSSDAALTAEQKKTLEDQAERKKLADSKTSEQQRKDRALLETFTTSKEIDLKRGRDIQQIEMNIEALQNNLKNAIDRQADLRARMEPYRKENKPVPASFQEDYDRTESSKAKLQAQVAAKRKDIADINVQYDDMKKRFAELTGAPSETAISSSAAARPDIPLAATSGANTKK